MKSELRPCISILCAVWLRDSVVCVKIGWTEDNTGTLIQACSQLLAAIFLASDLIYSQAATAKILLPEILALNVTLLTMVTAITALSGLIILPVYLPKLPLCIKKRTLNLSFYF